MKDSNGNLGKYYEKFRGGRVFLSENFGRVLVQELSKMDSDLELL